MKKVINLFAVAAFLLVSCAKETQPQSQPEPQPEPTPVGPKVAMTFGASVSDCVKTVLTDGNKIYWEKIDQIRIFDGTRNINCFKTTLTGDDPASSTTFTGEAVQAATYYALYPYDKDAEINGNVITTKLPSEQKAVPGSYDPKAALLACQSTNTQLTFLPAVAFLKFKVGVSSIKSVKVYANEGKAMAGGVTLTVGDDNVDVSSIPASDICCVELITEKDSYLSTNSYYYLAVRPEDYYNGISIILTNSSDKTITKVFFPKSGNLALAAGKIYDMGEISGSFDDEISVHKIFDDSAQNGWALYGEYEICDAAKYSGEKGIKWTISDAQTWAAHTLILESATTKDISDCNAIRFKMKFANSTCTAGNTVFRNMANTTAATGYGYNANAPADDSWRTITMPLINFYNHDNQEKVPDNLLKNFRRFCFLTPGWWPGEATIYIDDIELIGGNVSTSGHILLFDDVVKTDWKLGGTTGKYEICAEPSNSGNQVIKWTVDDAGSWARVLTLEPATAPTNISACTAIRFKMKFANSTCTAGNTVFQNRVYGKDSESYCNVYAPSDSEWQTKTMSFSDFTAQSGTYIWTKLNNFTFHTPGWYSGTATIYFDDIELIP